MGSVNESTLESIREDARREAEGARDYAEYEAYVNDVLPNAEPLSFEAWRATRIVTVPAPTYEDADDCDVPF